MQVDTKAPVFHTEETYIDASPEHVWKILTDINQWTSWKDNITKAHIDGIPEKGSVFTWTVNKAPITSTIHTVNPFSEFGWIGKTFGAKAIHNWYLNAEKGGTRLEVAESMNGWLVKLFKKKMNQDLKQDMQDWLERLKAIAEK